MAWIDEKISAQFHEWERRGRGWQLWPEPVHPEPPFEPFPGHFVQDVSFPDDGRRPTLASAFIKRLSERLSTKPPHPDPEPVSDESELSPELLNRNELEELTLAIPPTLTASANSIGHFLGTLTQCREPVAFEVVGTTDSINIRFVAHPADAQPMQRQLQAQFPAVPITRAKESLSKMWQELEDTDTAVFECGLAREFMFPLATRGGDVLLPLTAAMSELRPGELAIYQILFSAVRNPWAESIMDSVSSESGKPAFVNAPDILKAAVQKLRQPLYAVVVRLAVGSEHERAWEIARDMATALSTFANVEGNELIPLSNAGYPVDEHVEDVCHRQSRRSGMILNRDELAGFVHLPTDAVQSPKLRRAIQKTRGAPASALEAEGLVLGHNGHAGRSLPVSITPDERARHMHVIGASGTGKSTLLFNLIRQDIENGEGLAVLDPHGDLIEKVLEIIPRERIDDVIVVDPTDEEFSFGFNILSAHSDWEKSLLASDLVSVFERLSTSWGDQMASVLANAIRAFLESDNGGTLADLQRFLIDASYRTEFLKSVRDPAIVFYWQKSFPQLTGNRSIGPVLTRLDTFLGPKPIRYMVSQKENRLDFQEIMNRGKILLAKLPKGMLGDANTYLLGTLFVSKFQQTAMSRQQLPESARRDFWLYLDEFHNFITPSMAEILTGARKYRLGLILAHQELRQLERNREVASAALSSPHTRIVFRVGDADVHALESGFSHFEARDLQNLPTGSAIVRIGPSDADFNLSVSMPDETDENVAAARRDEVVGASRMRYAVPRAEIESKLAPLWTKGSSSTPARVEPRISPAVSDLPAIPEAPRIEKPAPRAVKPSATVNELGRGGAQHKAVQDRLKQSAEDLGFRVTIEKQILDGQGSVDLLLERQDVVIACEVSVMNTIDYEVGNVSKCLKAGFTQIAVVCTDEERLRKIATAVEGSLGTETASRISYHQPDAFIAYLRTLRPSALKPAEIEVRRRGYKIKRVHAKLSPEELKAQEDAALKMIAEAMRRKNK